MGKERKQQRDEHRPYKSWSWDGQQPQGVGTVLTFWTGSYRLQDIRQSIQGTQYTWHILDTVDSTKDTRQDREYTRWTLDRTKTIRQETEGIRTQKATRGVEHMDQWKDKNFQQKIRCNTCPSTRQCKKSLGNIWWCKTVLFMRQKERESN